MLIEVVGVAVTTTVAANAIVVTLVVLALAEGWTFEELVELTRKHMNEGRKASKTLQPIDPAKLDFESDEANDKHEVKPS